MKVLFVVELFYPNIGGNEKLFLTLGEELVKLGHEVTVITTKFNTDLPGKEIYNGIEIIRLSLFNRFGFTLLSLPTVIKYSKKADVIHTTSYNAAFPSWLASIITRTKAIITFHEVWGRLWFKLPYFNLFERFLFYTYERFILRLNFNLFIGVSDYTRNSLINAGVSKDRVLRIYNGLSNNSYSENEGAIGKKEFTYTYFGRLGSSKGIDLLMNASEEFLNAKNSKLLIISSSNPKHIYHRIVNWIARNNLQEKVEYITHLPYDKLIHQLKKSSCVVIPSYSEGFCYAAVECIALGIPVILSGKGALQEVASGKYIEMDEMSGEGLTRALEKAKRNEWTSTSIKKFLLVDTVRNYISVYSDLLES